MINYYNLIEVTKSELDSLITANELKLGTCYKITDRGDRGITLTAISSNKLSLEGIRTMLCPKTYKLETLDTNIWKGVWHSTKIAAIDDLMIWGGLVWKNLTGAIGTATNDIALDAVNWIEIPKASFTNNEYIEIIFSIHYDYERDWIVKQWDKNSNEFGIPKEGYEEYISTLGKNPVDISDWNYTNDDTTNELLIRNKCVGIWNNVEGIKIHHNICTGAIYGNSFTVANKSISGNYIGSPYGSISNNRLPNSIDANYCEGISGNTNNGSINGNQIVGSINSNSNIGSIDTNLNGGSINSNSGTGNITNAWSGKDISSRVLTTNIDYFPYKKYVTLLTQTGTNPPVPIVLEDTIGIDAEDYTRLDVGKYRITKVGAFPPIKTWLKSDTVRNVEEGYVDRGVYLQNSFSSGFYTSPDSIDITIGDANGLAEEDAVDLSFRGQIEIRVYN